MRVACISCFNSYYNHIYKFTGYFKRKNYTVKYMIQDFSHINKKYILDENPPDIDVVKIHVPAYQSNLSPKRLYSHYVFARKVYKMLCEFKPEIIYCMFPPNMLVHEVAKYKRKFGAKIIFDYWDAWPESFPFKKGKRYALIKPFLNIWRNLRDKNLPDADLILTISNNRLKLLREKFPENLSQVLHPARKPLEAESLPKYNFSKIASEMSFCYLGNVNFITDLEFAKKFFARDGKLSQNRKLKLHIIGEGVNLENLVTSLESEGIEIFTHGIIYDDETKREILSQCDFGLNIPRLEIGSDNMPLKAIDYVRAGLPLISTSLGEIHDLIARYNFGFNANDPDELAEKLLQLTSSDLERISENCLNNYERVFVQDIGEILGKIV